MTSQLRTDRVDRAALPPLISRAIESTAYLTLVIGYLTLVIGYLTSVLPVSHLTIANFLVFTGIQVLYAIAFWWVVQRDHSALWQVLLDAGVLLILTFVSGLLSALNFNLDWLLYFVTVSVYFTFFSVRSALIASIILYLAVGVNVGFTDPRTGLLLSWPSLLAGFAFVAAFALSNKLLNAQRERSETLFRQLEESTREREMANAQLQKYANEVEELTVDRERTRMAREIHDTLGHYLTILNIQLETISKLQERDPARAAIEVAEARRVAAQSMQEVRNAVAALRPSSIATLSLKEALTQLGDEFRSVTETAELTLDLDTEVPSLSPDLQLALYRAAQEALTNVRKHAHATKVLLRLRYEHEQAELVVLDNGQGSANDGTKHDSSGFGLIGLRERIELLGGHVMHGPAEPTGYRITIHVPAPIHPLIEDEKLLPVSMKGVDVAEEENV